jgi:hypothetical protein
MGRSKTLANEPFSVQGGRPVKQTVRQVRNLEEHQNVLPTRTHVVGTLCKRATAEDDWTL